MSSFKLIPSVYPVNLPVITPTTAEIYSPLTPTSPLVVLSDDSPMFTPTYLPSLTLDFVTNKPIFTFYDDLNSDPKIHKRLTKYYYYKTIDKWLYDDLSDILNYFTIGADGKVKLISNMSQYKMTNADKDTPQMKEKKIQFIENKIFKRYDMANLLYKFVREAGTKWVDLHKNEYYLKQVIEKNIIKRIKKRIK